MAKWCDEYLQQVTDCENRESRLTEWECNFLSSIREQLEDEKPLSYKQTDTLDSIWERATSKG